MKLSELKIKAPKFLIYGPAGTGKTALALTMPGAQIVDLDDGVMTGLTVKDGWENIRKETDVVQFLEDNPSTATAFLKAKGHILKVVNECRAKTYPHKALILDSLTTLSDFALRHVMKNDDKLGEQPGIQHWGRCFREIQSVILMLRTLPIPVILIAHDQTKTIDDQEKVEVAVPGKNLPNQITGYFDEVLYMEVTRKGAGEFAYSVRTKSTPSIRARSRFNLENFLDTKIGMEGILKTIGYEIQ